MQLSSVKSQNEMAKNSTFLDSVISLETCFEHVVYVRTLWHSLLCRNSTNSTVLTVICSLNLSPCGCLPPPVLDYSTLN